MAINVTQRLHRVSLASADIREAPRGRAQPEPSSSTTASKLLKVRRRIGIADAEAMASLVVATMVTPSKRKIHGTMYAAPMREPDEGSWRASMAPLECTPHRW